MLCFHTTLALVTVVLIQTAGTITEYIQLNISNQIGHKKNFTKYILLKQLHMQKLRAESMLYVYIS